MKTDAVKTIKKKTTCEKLHSLGLNVYTQHSELCDWLMPFERERAEHNHYTYLSLFVTKKVGVKQVFNIKKKMNITWPSSKLSVALLVEN